MIQGLVSDGLYLMANTLYFYRIHTYMIQGLVSDGLYLMANTLYFYRKHTYIMIYDTRFSI